MKANEVQRREEEIRDRLSGFDAVRFAFLFGSRAAGRPRPGSDIDLAVFVDEALSARERFDLRRRLVTRLIDLGKPDVVILNNAPPLLGHRVLRGRRIYTKDRTSYVRYFVRTLAAYQDERPWRRLHEEARRLRLREGRFGRP